MGEDSARGAIFAFSDVRDEAPSLVRVFASHSDIIWECQVVFPGDVPMIAMEHPISCQKTNQGEDLLLSVSYPQQALPPRTGQSPLEPPPVPARPPTVCDASGCSTTGFQYDPSPPYPHVQIHLSSSVAEGVTLMVEGNGRNLSLAAQLENPGAPGYGIAATYLDVDASR
jgi:hypothetical protein